MRPFVILLALAVLLGTFLAFSPANAAGLDEVGASDASHDALSKKKKDGKPDDEDFRLRLA